MPFTVKDVEKHTKKANTDKLKRQWVEVANSALEDCEAGDDECEAAAITKANGVIARAVASESDPPDELEEAMMKTVAGKKYPAGDFLVVEDSEKVDTWHLQVKKNGRPDHRLMAAARAALTSPGGHRGNKYEGPDKAAATTKLKALYKSEDMEWGEAEILDMTGTIDLGNGLALVRLGEVTGSLGDKASRVEQAFRSAFGRRTADGYLESPWPRDVFEDDPELGTSLVVSDDGLLWAVEYQTAEDGVTFADRDRWQQVELMYRKVGDQTETTEEVAEFAEAEVGQALSVTDITETDVIALGLSEASLNAGRRAPVLVDFQMIQPGPGNKKDNHYYPRPVLERDSGAFNGVDVFVTDHREAERSERTKVGRVRQAPARFTEGGAPVGQVVIYDPDMAEKARNRADAGELETLECSIYARGNIKPGKVNGVNYKVVEAITEGLYLELVSKAGAGGKALNLAESQGGNRMPENVEETTQEGATEEELHETETPALLAEADVKKLLSETRLPQASRDRLTGGEWADEEALKVAIAAEVEYIKAVSGSGQPFEQGGDQTTAVKETAQQRARRRAMQFNDIMAEVGITSRTPVPELQEA
jgi:hypothetical protein